MARQSSSTLQAGQPMQAQLIHLFATSALVGLADGRSKSHGNRYPGGVLIDVQAEQRKGECVQPRSAVGCAGSQEPGRPDLIGRVFYEVMKLRLTDRLVPRPLTSTIFPHRRGEIPQPAAGPLYVCGGMLPMLFDEVCLCLG